MDNLVSYVYKEAVSPHLASQIEGNPVEKDLKYIWHPCSQMKDYEELKPIIIDHGKGIYLYDKNGK